MTRLTLITGDVCLMLSIYQIKPWFQGLLRPLVIRLHARGVTANQVTVLAWLISMLLGTARLTPPSPDRRDAS